MDCSMPGFPVLSVSPGLCTNSCPLSHDTIQQSRPLSPPSSPAISISQHQCLFQLALCIRLPECWTFSINPSNDYSGLISFRIDWFDLLAVQGTVKSLLQHHSSKASILWCSVFFRVQLSHLPTKAHLVKAVVFPLVMYGWEKAMELHSSTLAWKIPWTEEPGR